MILKRLTLIAACASLLASCCGERAQSYVEDPVSMVSTLVGTESTYELSTGNTYPAVAMP